MKHPAIRSRPITSIKGVFFANFNSEKGYALPVILLVCMVIITLGMAMTFSLRSKIDVATELNDRAGACLKSYSAMNEVVYNVLTSTPTRTGMEIRQEDGSVIGEWNLYGQPIELSEGVTVTLRDTSGMIPILFGTMYLRELMMSESQDSKKVNAFVDALADWQDKDDFKRLNGAESFDYRAAGYPYTPRNFYIQTPQEVMLLKGFDKNLFDKINTDITYWGSGFTNYLTMSENLLRALLKDDTLVDRIIQLRKEGNLTAGTFMSMTGIRQDETSSFWPSGWIKIEIIARVEKAVDRIDAVIVKRQVRERPFVVTEWKR